MDNMGFAGFPEGFADFLFSLRFTNTEEMVAENKIKYGELITGPLTRLYDELAPVVAGIGKGLTTRPAKCVSTPYTDRRFSRGAPLKEYMYLRFREPLRERDILGFYFDMGCEHYSYGIRVYKQTASGMERVRQHALENKGPFIYELERLGGLGMTLYGEEYTKDHYPYVENGLLKGLLNKKGFRIGRERPVSPTVHCRDLAAEISDAYRALDGFYLLLKQSLGG
jgi:uncharacterized protein (DUF2461 family)